MLCMHIAGGLTRIEETFLRSEGVIRDEKASTQCEIVVPPVA